VILPEKSLSNPLLPDFQTILPDFWSIVFILVPLIAPIGALCFGMCLVALAGN
jgi:hypothetical protein